MLPPGTFEVNVIPPPIAGLESVVRFSAGIGIAVPPGSTVTTAAGAVDAVASTRPTNSDFKIGVVIICPPTLPQPLHSDSVPRLAAAAG